MKAPLLFSLAAGGLLVGCGKSEPAAPPSAPAPPPASASVETAVPEAPPSPAAAAGETPAEEGAEPPALAEIHRALNAYTMGQMKDPQTLDDLVKAGYLKRVPAAPPGKKFVLNANRTAVLIVDK